MAVDVHIVGDVKRVLRALTPLVRERRARRRARTTSPSWPSGAPSPKAASWHGSGAWRDGLLSADYVIGRLGELTDHDADARRPTSASTRCGWRATPASGGPTRTSRSGGLGTMGYGVPAAMGAALGRPDKETWAVVGDGGFQMTSQELMTLAADRIPVKIALHGQQEAGDDPPVAGDHLRRQLPLGAPARARTG